MGAADTRLALVRSRDSAADGRFVYAVKTTGVFCRPSCPSRPAKDENIVFYDTPQQAISDGFRPCRRCMPVANRGPAGVVATMCRVAEHIAANADRPLTLAQLGKVHGLSGSHLQRTFKAVMGVSPREYQAAVRLRVFKAGLRTGESVLDAAFEAGYGSTSRIHEQITGGLGMTPSAYRAGAAGEVITWAVTGTMLGPLMMGATERGVCFVEFGEDRSALLEALAAEFPNAALHQAQMTGNGPLHDWLRALDAQLSHGAPRPNLPLDLRGTAFQIRVWRFLLSVKPGDTVSYSGIAKGVGAPRAVRAAASACGANRIAVLIPCHRALRSDGAPGGYRWGLERKQALIDLEQRAVPGDQASR